MEKSYQKPCDRQLRSSARKPILTLGTTISHEKNAEVGSVITEVDPELNNLNSPLQNPLITNYIFNLLELDDLKQCRLVCSKWNQLSISVLKKMSVITLGCPRKGYFEVTAERSPKTFKEFSQNSTIDFQAFKLTSFELHDAVWPMDTFVEFFQDQRETMRKFIIHNIHIQGHAQQRPRLFSVKNYFDISPHIDNQLAHLSIINDNGSRFMVATNKLTSAKSISLDHCALEISENCFLSPEKLELNHVALVKWSKLVHGVVINDFLEFEHLKELTIDGTTNTWINFRRRVTDGSSVALDLARNVKLNYLSLKNVSLVNYNNSRWVISEKLKLRGIPLADDVDKLGMKFTELDFGYSPIKLNLLPESLERLTLSQIEDDWWLSLEITCPPLFSLPNLTYLHLVTVSSLCRAEDDDNEVGNDNDENESSDEDDEHNNDQHQNVAGDEENSSNNKNAEEEDSDDDEEEDDENPLQWLNFFLNCHNLTTVKLTCAKKYYRLCSRKILLNYPPQRLHTEWIPKSTENIFLTGNIRAIGEEFEFNKLVIENNCLDFLTSTLKRLRCKHLVLDLTSKSKGGFTQLEKILLKLIKMPYESVAIGSLELIMGTSAFKKSSFSNFVDEKANCYLFNKQKGKAIKEWEFKKMLEI